MAPESAAPSALAYRGSIIALVLASLVTVFLIVRPPESESKEDTLRPVATSTPAIAATATPTRAGATTPTGTRTTASATTPAGSPTVATTPTPSERTYTVKSGDTLSGIAAEFNTTVAAILAANPGLTEILQIGQVIKLPPPQ